MSLVPVPTPSSTLFLQSLLSPLLATPLPGPLFTAEPLAPGDSGTALARLGGAPLATLESAVESRLRGATGPEGLLLVLLYSFLCAVVLPLPGELVLVVPLELGWSPTGELAAVVAVASAGKALGALATLAVARGATAAGPIVRLIEILPRGGRGIGSGLTARLAGLVDRYGSLGLVGALSVPFTPDTAILYAFSALNVRLPSFAAAAFLGTAIRLTIVAGIASALLALF